MDKDNQLFLAISSDNISEVMQLISGLDDIDSGIKIQSDSTILHSKPSPLSISCFLGAIESFNFLLNSGASIEHEDLRKIIHLQI